VLLLVLLLLLVDNEVKDDADGEVDEVDDDDGVDALDEELIAGLVALLLGTPALDRRSTFKVVGVVFVVASTPLCCCCCWSSCC